MIEFLADGWLLVGREWAADLRQHLGRVLPLMPASPQRRSHDYTRHVGMSTRSGPTVMA
jgi:hypothetical protein